jgi:hypothetical protein
LGTALYFFMGGPAADPSYNGTTSEAYNWGQRQAEAATNTYNSSGPSIETELMFMDIEGLDNEGIYGTGWNDVVQPCNNNHIVSYGIAYSVDRAAFNGFWDYIQNDTIFYPGVYSSPDMWNNTFGTGSYGSIPGTFEWTYENDTGSTNAPSNFCYGSTCAAWFGGTNYPVAWQWAIGNTDGGAGDFDIIDMCTYDDRVFGNCSFP